MLQYAAGAVVYTDNFKGSQVGLVAMAFVACILPDVTLITMIIMTCPMVVDEIS